MNTTGLAIRAIARYQHPLAHRRRDAFNIDDLFPIDWETVRNIAKEQGWEWDAKIGRFVADGVPVPYDTILEVTRAELGQIEAQISQATTSMIDESSTIPEWQERLSNEMG